MKSGDGLMIIQKATMQQSWLSIQNGLTSKRPHWKDIMKSADGLKQTAAELTGRSRRVSLTAADSVLSAAKSSKVGTRGLGWLGVASRPNAASSETIAASTCQHEAIRHKLSSNSISRNLQV